MAPAFPHLNHRALRRGAAVVALLVSKSSPLLLQRDGYDSIRCHSGSVDHELVELEMDPVVQQELSAAIPESITSKRWGRRENGGEGYLYSERAYC